MVIPGMQLLFHLMPPGHLVPPTHYRAKDRDCGELPNLKSIGRGGKRSQESESGLYVSTVRRFSISTKFKMNLMPPTTMDRGRSSKMPGRRVGATDGEEEAIGIEEVGGGGLVVAPGEDGGRNQMLQTGSKAKGWFLCFANHW
ncbi:hypothetical protein PanWU01x14_124780 [Parasponia andersonii]|uniref:Uncharacterized protein n=1 Tax=Parasponia andersonii TaxID=3476 RepID=A0A2P5CTN7_PARAD|nr:hypothetical protein PanWU01x14_124780 [Parasponia andersonii]